VANGGEDWIGGWRIVVLDLDSGTSASLSDRIDRKGIFILIICLRKYFIFFV
jgi:hypothetical protein